MADILNILKIRQTRNFVKKEAGEAKGILGRIKRRDLKGNSGQLIKNSSWQLATTLTAKIGSLLFTIIIARLMLPEIYGLYGLALSTILFMGIFSDFGIFDACLTFVSKTIDKRPGKAKGYYYTLTKYKILLTIMASLILLFTASWLANSYYNKPIYYALLAGLLYLPISIFVSHITPLFSARNDFQPQFVKEIIVQVSRLIIVPISIIYFLAKTTSIETYLSSIFLILSFCYFLGGAYLLITAKIKRPFRNAKIKPLISKEKKDLIIFILPLSVTALSGVFFGFIDQIMLGHYVESQFLGYYQAAFNLIASASLIISFSAAAVFPILARIKGDVLERGFRRTRNITFLISIIAAIFTFLLSKQIISIIYGSAYSSSIIYLQTFSLLIISFPIISLYTSYYTSQKRTKTISIILIVSTIINIILNYFFITYGLQFGMTQAVLGACIATIISRYSYLAMLIAFRKK